MEANTFANGAPTGMPNKSVSLFIRQLPAGLKKQFKSYCADNSISMTDKIIQLMLDTVDHRPFDKHQNQAACDLAREVILGCDEILKVPSVMTDENHIALGKIITKMLHKVKVFSKVRP